MSTTEFTAGSSVAILNAVKEIMRRRKLRYHHLAEALRISLPSAKRLMTSADVPLSRLLSICDWLGLSLQDLLGFIESKAAQGFRFSSEQEQFFAKRPAYLAYFFQLASKRKKPSQIAREFGITKHSTERYLQELERLGLAERLPNGEVRVTVEQATFLWDDHGILGQVYSRHFISEMSDRALAQLEKPQRLYLATGGKMLTKEQIAQFRRDVEDVLHKYRIISSVNKATGIPALEEWSYVVIADVWSDPFFDQVIELAN